MKDEPDHLQAPGATGNSILSNTCPAGGISTSDPHHNSWCLILPLPMPEVSPHQILCSGNQRWQWKVHEHTWTYPIHSRFFPPEIVRGSPISHGNDDPEATGTSIKIWKSCSLCRQEHLTTWFSVVPWISPNTGWWKRRIVVNYWNIVNQLWPHDKFMDVSKWFNMFQTFSNYV